MNDLFLTLVLLIIVCAGTITITLLLFSERRRRDNSEDFIKTITVCLLKGDKSETTQNLFLQNELTKTHLVILQKLIEGKTNKEIAEDMFISQKTVEAHLRELYRRMAVKSRTEAVSKAMKMNFGIN